MLAALKTAALRPGVDFCTVVTYAVELMGLEGLVDSGERASSPQSVYLSPKRKACDMDAHQKGCAEVRAERVDLAFAAVVKQVFVAGTVIFCPRGTPALMSLLRQSGRKRYSLVGCGVSGLCVGKYRVVREVLGSS